MRPGRITQLKTLWRLGPANLVRVGAYRLGLRLGVHPAQRIVAPTPPRGPFFAPPAATVQLPSPDSWRDTALLFGHYRLPLGETPPDWLADPSRAGDGSSPCGALQPWWEIPDFASGDIKRIWELSRFDWVLAFAQQARGGDRSALVRLERWLADWAAKNPPYLGPNWKCAQEASIRLEHLALAAMILGNETAMLPAMRSLVDAHVRRILPTLSYARGQDNNHATSEAAALYIAGAWLKLAGQEGAISLLRRGRALVESSTLRLFDGDGSFSQYSTNYHRVALDSMALVEVWRRRAGQPEFSARWSARMRAASDWMRSMIDPVSGGVPNLGANDGASLLPLSGCGILDFRPSAQLAHALFAGKRAFAPGPWDRLADWLEVDLPPSVEPQPQRAVFPDGGYAVIRRDDAMAMMRVPVRRFRPSQSDALHVDLWAGGRNLLRDGGSYSYNSGDEWIDYFGGVESHNTAQFDGLPQMRRVSRFLLADWLEAEAKGETGDGFQAAYRSPFGWRHQREIALGKSLVVFDDLSGFEAEACLRWRLAPGNWRIEDAAVTNGRDRLTIRGDVLLALSIATGWESRYYLEKTALPVLEVRISRPGRVISEYHWQS